MIGRTCCLTMLLALVGCDEQKPVAKVPKMPLQEGVLQYFPIQKGLVWSYQVRANNLENGPSLLLVSRIESAHNGEAVISTGDEKLPVFFDSKSVARDPQRKSIVLKWPLQVGETWPCKDGSTCEVLSTTARVNTPAGEFSSCLMIVEKWNGAEMRSMKRTYCPSVGLTVIEEHSLDRQGKVITAKALLRSYGPSEDLSIR